MPGNLEKVLCGDAQDAQGRETQKNQEIPIVSFMSPSPTVLSLEIVDRAATSKLPKKDGIHCQKGVNLVA